jgi:hypothetical protein
LLALFERSEASSQLWQPRLDRDHPPKDFEIDSRRATDQRVIRQIIMHAGLRDYADPVADSCVISEAGLAAELAPTTNLD